MLEDPPLLLPLAMAMACFISSLSIMPPPFGTVRAATPLFSLWLEGMGSEGLPR